MRTPLALVALAALLAGCAGAAQPASRTNPTPAPAATAAPSATATPDRPLIAVSENAGAGRTTFSLSTLDGRRIASTTRNRAEWTGVGGGMVTFVEGGALMGLTPAGTVERLGAVTGWTAGPVVVSPDGQRWMWSASSTSASATTSSLMLGGRGAADRVVARLTSQERGLQPFRWGAAGPVYQQAAMGIGGYILFGDAATGPSFRFDAGTGQATTVLGGNDCHLADLAADGTIACIRTGATPMQSSLSVLSPGGHVVDVPLPSPAFTQRGAVSFAPGSNEKLVIGGGASVGADGPPERYETDLFDAGSRQLHSLGPAGLRPAPGPWNWLPDGSVLAYRPSGAFGGSPGIYIIRPDGTTAKLLPAGSALGVIT
jgi:hypothetical protein